LEQASRVLNAKLLKYLESEIKSPVARVTTREIVRSNCAWDTTSDGKEV
jgi:hypothetical protein